MIPAFFDGMELMFFVLHGFNTEEMAVTSFITVQYIRTYDPRWVYCRTGGPE